MAVTYKRKEEGKGWSSKYIGVSGIKINGRPKYVARITIDGESRFIGYYEKERKAAIAYDKALINNNEEPVNILKRLIKKE